MEKIKNKVIAVYNNMRLKKLQYVKNTF